MYEAFDSFIRVGTWQTRQPSDEERFHLALGKVAWSLPERYRSSDHRHRPLLRDNRGRL
jgi:hypothetical protein